MGSFSFKTDLPLWFFLKDGRSIRIIKMAENVASVQVLDEYQVIEDDPAHFLCLVEYDGVEGYQPYSPKVGFLISSVDRVLLSYLGKPVLELCDDRRVAYWRSPELFTETEYSNKKKKE